MFIDRLYTSFIERHGEKKIQGLIKLIQRAERKNIPVINSAKGYVLDLDRRKQFEYFSSKGFPFAQISTISSILSPKKSIIFPVVAKTNPSGRTKRLLIIQNQKELLKSKVLFLDQNTVLQPLIKEKICYRTEFVGDWNSTYIQIVDFYKKYLKFRYGNKIVSTPLPNLFKEKLINEMKKIRISAFSIEYFFKNKMPIIVDFNLISNYPRFFIEKVGDELKRAWLNLIKNSLKK